MPLFLKTIKKPVLLFLPGFVLGFLSLKVLYNSKGQFQLSGLLIVILFTVAMAVSLCVGGYFAMAKYSRNKNANELERMRIQNKEQVDKLFREKAQMEADLARDEAELRRLEQMGH